MESRRAGPYYGWVIVFTLGITAILAQGATQFFFSVLVVPLEQEFGWSRAAIAGAYSCGFVVCALLGLPVGRLVDRHGARALMTAGSLVAGVSFLGMTQVRELSQLYLAWGLGVGVAMALTLYTVAFTIVTNWFHRRRGTALGLVTLMGGLAVPLTVPAAGWLIQVHGWRFTVGTIGVAFLVVNAPVQAFFLRRRPEDLGLALDGVPARTTAFARASASGVSLRQGVRQTAFWTLTLSGVFANAGWAALVVHQIAFMVWRGHNPVLAASIVGLMGLTSLPGRFLLSLLGDALGAQRVLALTQVCQCAGIVVLIVAPSLPWLIAYATIYGVALGAGGPLRAATFAGQFGRRSYGSITAAAGALTSLSAGAGPLLAGWLFDRTQSYFLPFWLTAACTALAAVLVLVTPAPRPAPPAERLLPTESEEPASEVAPAPVP